MKRTIKIKANDGDHKAVEAKARSAGMRQMKKQLTENDPLTGKEWAELCNMRNDLCLLEQDEQIPRQFREQITAARIILDKIRGYHDTEVHIPRDGFEIRRKVEHQWPLDIRERWEAYK